MTTTCDGAAQRREDKITAAEFAGAGDLEWFEGNALRTAAGDGAAVAERMHAAAGDVYAALIESMAAGDLAGVVKAHVMYGRPIARGPHTEAAAMPGSAVRMAAVADLIHAVLGMASEAGELAAAIARHVATGEPLDVTNVLEELGDSLWFANLGADAAGSCLREVMIRNIRKLRRRFPEGTFTEGRANVRDLAAEVVALRDAPDLVLPLIG